MVNKVANQAGFEPTSPDPKSDILTIGRLVKKIKIVAQRRFELLTWDHESHVLTLILLRDVGLGGKT